MELSINDYVVEVNETNAQQILIEESSKRPVVVDFWADWCAPCKTLMPLLEKLADEYQGDFLLAKVNADEQQMITSQFGVRSLPTVVIMKDGQPVDGFAGAQPETAIREILDKHLPKPFEKTFQAGMAKMAEENWAEAVPFLKDAMAESNDRADIVLQLALAYMELNRVDEVEGLLAKVKMVDQDALYEQLKARVELHQASAKSPEIQALEQRLNENPDDKEAAFQLAVQFSQGNHYRDALELLLNLLRQDLGYADGQARKAFTDILTTLGQGDALAIEYQRKFYTLLY